MSNKDDDDDDYDPSVLDRNQFYTQRTGCLKTKDNSRAYSRKHESAMFSKVHFRNVCVREYTMILGDNPAVSHGAPVQLDWKYKVLDPCHIDEWEQKRKLSKALAEEGKDGGVVMNAHRRVKILLTAGHSIDEIAKVTMEMKELKQQRAESLKSEGILTNVWELLSGVGERSGHTARKGQVLGNAMNGFTGLTGRVLNATAKGTTNIVIGTGTFVVKGTTGVVKGTSKAITTTGIAAKDVVVGTGKLVTTGATGVVRGTGLIFAGTGQFVKNSSKRLTRMVSNHDMLSGSSHQHDQQEQQPQQQHLSPSPTKKQEKFLDSILRAQHYSQKLPPQQKEQQQRGRSKLPNQMVPIRQRSFDNSRTASSRRREAQQQNEDDDVYGELLSMEEFVAQLKGMDPQQVQAILAKERLDDGEDESLHTQSLH